MIIYDINGKRVAGSPAGGSEWKNKEGRTCNPAFFVLHADIFNC
jgi:hypothetical protein